MACLRAHLSHYSAPRTLLAVSGAFDPAQARAWAQQWAADWPQAAADAPAPPAHLEPVVGGLRVLPAPLERTQVALAWPGVGTLENRRDAAGVLSELIGGDNGFLYWALLDTGLADSADFGHLDFRDCGVFEGGFSCDPGRTAEALAAYQAALRDAQDFTPQQLGRAKRKLAVHTLARAETPQGRLFALGLEAAATGQVVTPEAQAARWQAVSADEVRALLGNILAAPLTGVVLGKLGDLAAEDLLVAGSHKV
ncbi:insulinase family protein [Deinococcus lacus]|uniref:Insulinase family protein n=1 Tax=Deinococcus lacus TaxID=392561 RepID=A0ABW1YFL8_9DEIO